MFDMDYRITIGDKRLMNLESVEIQKAVDQLQDTATVVIPGMASGYGLSRESLIKRGVPIEIQLGYNGELKKEFQGYISHVCTDGAIEMQCEDGIFLFRKDIPNKAFKNPSVVTIIRYVASQVKVAVDIEKALEGIKFDKFLIENVDGFTVLKKIKEDANIDLYMRGETLYARLPFAEKKGKVIYSFQKNITYAEIKYLSADQRKLFVSVSSFDEKGKRITGTFGKSGGDITHVTRPNIKDIASLKNTAKNLWEKSAIAGYQGGIETCLIPYATYGYHAKIIDQEYPYRAGIYSIRAVEVSFSKDGGVRKLTLGKKWT